MSKIKNEAQIHEEKIDINRSQIQHRATWMSLMFDEMRKRGYPAEEIARAAIRRTGNFHGTGIKSGMDDIQNLAEFEKAFLNEVGIKTFEMDIKKSERDDLVVEFNYCPLTEGWQKQGFSDEDCDLLCDMAMDGDRGIADAMGYTLELSDTIAKGCQTCKLHFKKKD